MTANRELSSVYASVPQNSALSSKKGMTVQSTVDRVSLILRSCCISTELAVPGANYYASIAPIASSSTTVRNQ